MGEEIGLLSAFLLSVSFYTIRYTLMEMDLTAIFFLMLAVYAFIISIEKGKFSYLAAICIGLAALVKTLSLFFVPAFLLGFFLLDSEWRKNFKKNLIRAFLFGCLILVLFSPILIHNYLWYKDSGMVDTYFAQYFNIGEARQAYAGQLGYDSGFLSSRFFEGIFTVSKNIFWL